MKHNHQHHRFHFRVPVAVYLIVLTVSLLTMQLIKDFIEKTMNDFCVRYHKPKIEAINRK